MTTIVKVEAHCPEDKKVFISFGDEKTGGLVHIENGQKWEGVVHGTQSITVQEVDKHIKK